MPINEHTFDERISSADLSMTDQQRSIVQGDWARILPRAERFADVLYEELFSAEPQLRLLFESPMDEQHRKLADVLTKVVNSLGRPDETSKMLSALGQRHAGYGVKSHHFAAMKPAFMQALDRMLGESFSAEDRAAWAAFFDLVSKGMLAVA